MAQMIDFQKLFDRFDMTGDDLAALTGLTVDDVSALLDAQAGEVPARVIAIVRLLKSAGVAKSSSIIHFLRESTPNEWQQIPDYPAYEASQCGAIRRRTGSTARLRALKPIQGSRGYLKVTLYDRAGSKRAVPIHRAVCRAWHGEPEHDRQFACHRNGDRHDNRAANLYWGTPSDNALDCVAHGRNVFANPGLLVQTPYSRDTARKVRVAHKSGIITYKQMLEELKKFA